jgi:hypothetical protein
MLLTYRYRLLPTRQQHAALAGIHYLLTGESEISS